MASVLPAPESQAGPRPQSKEQLQQLGEPSDSFRRASHSPNGNPKYGMPGFQPAPPPAAHSPPQHISVITPSPPTARGPFQTGLIDRPACPHPVRSQPGTACGYPSDIHGPFQGHCSMQSSRGGSERGVFRGQLSSSKHKHARMPTMPG